MGIRLRSSRQTLAILEALLARPGHWHHGYAISCQTSIPSGTLYPILMRLDKLGWLETRWEDSVPQGRPLRHLYRLTGNGREWAREELRSAQQREFWKPAASQA
jgi:PadR family transcriptional regulator, regulatory protein PadR